MSSITEQFSAVTKSQLETQFHVLNSLAHTALDSTEKLLALQLSTTKASVEQSSATARKLLASKDAGEFFCAGREAPTGIDSLLAYGRELFAIASGVQAEWIKSTRVTPLPHAAAAAAAPLAAAAEATAPVAEVPALPALHPATAAAPRQPDTAPVVAVPAAEAAAPAASIAAAVSAVVHGDEPPAPAPLAATVAPTAPEAIQPGLKPIADIEAAAKPIALAADSKTPKLKAVAPKAKAADLPAGKHKK
ncbi:hypothetical protein ASF61_11005 [Duganella sp. Leaf126]|uniref:phasin family protein n=1 Tax=Duganella sp. Leaf126 TaxID=1736266 RepID=UPI0006FE1A3F|nr:phasin family protein [Duganella sp. Leaf126]KQQ33593.1 hypothetical protein ASF61_11005 [Duganella sp. Leaf126]